MSALGISGPITAKHGQIVESPTYNLPVFIFFHPAYLMHSQGTERFNTIKAQMKEDIAKLAELCTQRSLDVFN